MSSTVYYTNTKTTFGNSLLHKLETLWHQSNASEKIMKNDLVAIKMHFGEPGNLAYLRPPFARTIVELIKKIGGKPFLTDANTLYVGQRSEAVGHILAAAAHGYTLSSVGAPITIADGLRGLSYQKLPIHGGRYCQEAKFGQDLIDADALVVLSHFKGHVATGFGGAIKNLSMGGASRAGKQELHADSIAEINKNLCIGCRRCLDYCAVQALYIQNNRACIDTTKCQGCGECVAVCRQNAITPRFSDSHERMQKKLAEYLKAISDFKKDKLIYINILLDISPGCDCMDHNNLPLCEDIGILLGFDPIAIDQASFDLVNKTTGKDNTFLEVLGIDGTLTLAYGEELAIGTRHYQLVEI